MRKYLLILCMVAAANAQASTTFIADVVKQHNVYRALHGVPDVKDDVNMNSYAQQSATYLASTNSFKTNPDNRQVNYGENVSWMPSSANGSQHVDNLYKEEAKLYADNGWCGKEPYRSEFDHYTQIVWRDSKKIGVGKSEGLVVINYAPRGNIYAMYAENVPCPSS